MRDWLKALITGSVAGAVVSGIVSFGLVSYKLEKELHSKQAEAGYEELVKANTLLKQAIRLEKEPDADMRPEAKKLRRQSEAAYDVALYKIAAFGHERVVHALSAYWAKYQGAGAPCSDAEKFQADVKTYRAIRTTMGVGGHVTDEQLGHLVFSCTVK
jgi:hypothetical protein